VCDYGCCPQENTRLAGTLQSSLCSAEARKATEVWGSWPGVLKGKKEWEQMSHSIQGQKLVALSSMPQNACGHERDGSQSPENHLFPEGAVWTRVVFASGSLATPCFYYSMFIIEDG
jgi:hypothetical protein